MNKNKAKVKVEREERSGIPEKYEVYIGNELAIQAIWKVIIPAVPGETGLAALLTNRAYSLGIPLNELRGLNREALINRILTKGGAK